MRSFRRDRRTRPVLPWDEDALVGEDSLRKAIREFVEHHHAERNHQGLGNRLIIPLKDTGRNDRNCPES